MRKSNDIIFDDSTITADARGEEVELTFMYGLSLQIISNAAAGGSGVLKIEASNDDGATWTELASPTQAISGAASSSMIVIENAFYDKIRMFYDHTAGTVNSIQVVMNGKGT